MVVSCGGGALGPAAGSWLGKAMTAAKADPWLLQYCVQVRDLCGDPRDGYWVVFIPDSVLVV